MAFAAAGEADVVEDMLASGLHLAWLTTFIKLWDAAMWWERVAGSLTLDLAWLRFVCARSGQT
eukprot:5435262-Prorocentrum_lima.AAC.1